MEAFIKLIFVSIAVILFWIMCGIGIYFIWNIVVPIIYPEAVHLEFIKCVAAGILLNFIRGIFSKK